MFNYHLTDESISIHIKLHKIILNRLIQLLPLISIYIAQRGRFLHEKVYGNYPSPIINIH